MLHDRYWNMRAFLGVALVIGLTGCGMVEGRSVTSSSVPLSSKVIGVPTNIRLVGAPNFREVGGYRTADGHSVRHGLLYRSENLSRLTPDDYRAMDGLGIRTIVDLRTAEERQSAPTLWRVPSGQVPTTIASDKHSMRQGFGAPVTDASAARRMLSAFYAGAPDTYAPEYKAMFRALVDGRTPLIVHCTAGKDRTGVAVALILYTLGVPREIIVQDFQETERRAGFADSEPKMRAFLGDAGYERLGEEGRRAMWRADPIFIDAAFDSIIQHYGSVDNYLEKRLDITAHDRTSLRLMMLQ